MDELTLKHLDLIQAVITRMASISFILKGWSVTVVSAIIVASATSSIGRLLPLAFLPALCFWGLDAFYLRQERLFRALYELIIDPAASAAILPLSMNTAPVESKVPVWSRTLWARTLFPLHGSVVAILVIVTFVTFKK